MDNNWLSKLTTKAIRLYKKAAGNHRQDQTRPILENLQNDGYSVVTWNSGNAQDEVCRNLNKQTWTLEDFLAHTEYDAPLFSRSHPGDESCTLVVSGDGLPDVTVDSYGDIDENIGTSKPIKTPTELKPKVKLLAPKPEPVVVEKSKEPEKKKVYVPYEEAHEQKDPFEKQISEENKQELLKDVDKEIEEKLPVGKPTEEEIEEWQRGLERETALSMDWLSKLFK